MMMDKVEKAVIAKDGVWEGYDPDHEMYLLTDNAIGETRYVFWFPNPTIHEDWVVEYICSESEFMEARKRLENKPTEWPEGRNYLIQQPNGGWGFSTNRPVCGKDGWRIADIWVSTVTHGQVFGDWRQSLDPRPQPDHKEGEGVEWDGKGIAPVGINARCARYANPVKVLFSTNQVAVVESDWGEQRALDPELVLPLKSRRDKVIEAANEVFKRIAPPKSFDGHTRRQILEFMYKEDVLKLPGEEE